MSLSTQEMRGPDYRQAAVVFVFERMVSTQLGRLANPAGRFFRARGRVPAAKAERPLSVQSRDLRGDAGQRARRAESGHSVLPRRARSPRELAPASGCLRRTARPGCAHTLGLWPLLFDLESVFQNGADRSASMGRCLRVETDMWIKLYTRIGVAENLPRLRIY